MRTAPTILLSLAILAIPGLFWLEKHQPEIWQNRALWPASEFFHDRHTPLFTSGTILPPTISTTTTYTAADNPILITQPTTLEHNTNLTFEKGTNIFVHEHASLTINGTASFRGTDAQPITVTSNERHPLNRLWGGLIVTESGQLTTSHTKISYAEPGISCLAGSQTEITNTIITHTQTSFYTEDNNCQYVRPF